MKAHNFVPAEFWKNQLTNMRNVYIPNSTTWLYEQDNRSIGFFSLSHDTLAAVFVHPDFQGKGIGKKLLNKAKSLRNQLNLTVYSENTHSVEFYTKQGFLIVQEQTDVHTKRKELLMKMGPLVAN